MKIACHFCPSAALIGVKIETVPAGGGLHPGAGSGAASIRAEHRSGKAGDVYFVANLDRVAHCIDCDFAMTGKQPELRDPVTGTERDLTDFSLTYGRTTVPLSFDSVQSFFIVFRKSVAAAGRASRQLSRKQDALRGGGTWQVTFDPNWAAHRARSNSKIWTTRRRGPGHVRLILKMWSVFQGSHQLNQADYRVTYF